MQKIMYNGKENENIYDKIKNLEETIEQLKI